MLLEIDEALINPGDDVETLRKKLDGLVLYCHILPVDDGEVVKTVRELCDMGVVLSITLNTKKYG